MISGIESTQSNHYYGSSIQKNRLLQDGMNQDIAKKDTKQGADLLLPEADRTKAALEADLKKSFPHIESLDIFRGGGVSSMIKGEKKAPYAHLADESGIIHYKGATFVCNNEEKSISLGDMSKADEVLSIPLSDGGMLNVNRDNIDQLAKAISMFSPEDINLIMRAIAQDAKSKKTLEEIDEIMNSIGTVKNEATESAKTESAKTESAKTESAKTESAKTESAKTESAKTESAKTESAKTESAKTEEPYILSKEQLDLLFQ